MLRAWFGQKHRAIKCPPPNRFRPYDLEAEKALLGGMLLSQDAIVAATAVRLMPHDLFQREHAVIYEAILNLYKEGVPADPVTVAEELRRSEQLESIGGGGALILLQAGTPSIGGAHHYARIVEEYSLLRRYNSARKQIARKGWR